MGRVRAMVDIRTARGLLVAPEGKFGVAVLNTRGKLNSDNFGKVPVRWNGRQKLYWALKEDLEFVNTTPIQAELYVARAPEHMHPRMPVAPGNFEYNYGHNLRRFRRMRKMKQWQLAEGVSKILQHPVSQTTVSYWERNAGPPRGAYLNAVAVVLDIPAFIFLLNMDDCCWLEDAKEYVHTLAEKTCEEEPF